MDNPLHVLKQALRLRNWKMVEAAYGELTGEEPPAPWAQATPVVMPETLRRDAIPVTADGVPESVATGHPDQEQQEESAPQELILGTEADLAALEASKPAPQQPAQPAHRVDVNQFRVQREESRVRSEGGTYARTEDDRPMQQNVYKDDLKVAQKELQQDKLLIEKGVRPAQRAVDNRPPPGMVQATCRECNNVKNVPVAEAPVRRLAKDDSGGSTYICDNCVGNKVKARRGS